MYCGVREKQRERVVASCSQILLLRDKAGLKSFCPCTLSPGNTLKSAILLQSAMLSLCLMVMLGTSSNSHTTLDMSSCFTPVLTALVEIKIYTHVFLSGSIRCSSRTFESSSQLSHRGPGRSFLLRKGKKVSEVQWFQCLLPCGSSTWICELD